MSQLARLSRDQQAELEQRIGSYRPGSGDHLVAKFTRMDPRVRTIVRSALVVGTAAPFVLDPQLRELEAHDYGTSYERMRAAEISPGTYFDHYQHRLRYELARRVTDHALAAPHPQVAWALPAAQMADALDAALDAAATHAGAFDWMLAAVLHPVDPRAIAARFIDDQVGSTPTGAPDPVPPWRSEIAIGLAAALRSQLVAALPRVGLRPAAQLEHQDEVSQAAIVPSAPIDRVISDLLFTPGAITFRHRTTTGEDAAAQPGAMASGVRPLVRVDELGATDGSLWNWVKPVTPGDATPEEIAAHYLGDPARAYAITAARPDGLGRVAEAHPAADGDAHAPASAAPSDRLRQRRRH